MHTTWFQGRDSLSINKFQRGEKLLQSFWTFFPFTPSDSMLLFFPIETVGLTRQAWWNHEAGPFGHSSLPLLVLWLSLVESGAMGDSRLESWEASQIISSWQAQEPRVCLAHGHRGKSLRTGTWPLWLLFVCSFFHTAGICVSESQSSLIPWSFFTCSLTGKALFSFKTERHCVWDRKLRSWNSY